MSKIIGISGKRGSGKDLLATYLKAFGYEKRSFAAPLKAAVRRDFGLTEEHTDGALKESLIQTGPYSLRTPRNIMIEYGQFFRTIDPDYWVKKALADIPDEARIVIPDMRFLNELEAIKALGGFLVRLERKPELNVYGAPIDDISETALDNYAGWDYTVPAEYNIYPSDLEAAAARIIEKLL